MNEDVIIIRDDIPENPVPFAIYLSKVGEDGFKISVIDAFGGVKNLVQNRGKTLRFFIGAGIHHISYKVKPIQNIIQDDDLKKVMIVGSMTVNGLPVEHFDAGIKLNNILGTLDFTNYDGLVNGDKIVIVIQNGTEEWDCGTAIYTNSSTVFANNNNIVFVNAGNCFIDNSMPVIH